MTITLNAASKASGYLGTVHNAMNLTVDAGSGSNRLLVLVVVDRSAASPVTEIIFNGVALSEACKLTHSSASPILRVGIYYLVNPDTGSHTLTVNWFGNVTQTRLMAAVYDGVLQTNPLDQVQTGEGNSAAPSVSITPTVNGELIVGGIVHEATIALSAGTGETSLYNNDEGAWVDSSSYVIQTTAGEQTVDWSSSEGANLFVIAAASFKAAETAGTVTGAATLAGSGAAQGAALNVVPAGASLSGAGGALAASLLNITARAAAPGAGQLQAASLVIVPSAASLPGGGSLAGTAVLIVPGGGGLAGAGALSGGAILIIPGAGQLGGAGGLSGDGVNLGQLVLGAAMLAGAGGLSGSPALSVLGTAVLTGLADVDGAAVLTVIGAAQATGAGASSGTAALIIQAIGQLLGTGALRANGRIVGLTLVLPDGRTFVLEIDVRTLTVPVEDRTFVAEAENRVYQPA